MAMSAPTGESEYNTTINVVPLVDIMLVLLIIFIITLPVATESVSIDLPRQTDAPPPDNPVPPITITVQSDGAILWNGTAASLADIRAYVADAASKPADQQPEVHIAADKRARYQHIADVLFIVQKGKLKKIGFVGDSAGGI